MTTRRDLYDRANAEWPATVPPLTFAEAEKAARRLYRHATGKLLPMPCKETTGRRYTWPRRGELRINAGHGWKQLVHLLSHWLFRLRHPNERPHGKAHARFERRLIRQVVQRGWLDGRLKTTAKEPTPTPAPVPEQRATAAIEHAERMLAKATTRAKRAETIRRKWERRLRARQRAAAAKATPAQ